MQARRILFTQPYFPANQTLPSAATPNILTVQLPKTSDSSGFQFFAVLIALNHLIVNILGTDTTFL
jgi:hypothetical protein